jgi:hypothetical protein
MSKSNGTVLKTRNFKSKYNRRTTMAGMKDMLLWMKMQQNKPEYAAARNWLQRNQTPLPETPKKSEPKEIEVVDETPEDQE